LPPWGSAAGITDLTSAIGISGRNLKKSRNRIEKKPKVPKNVKISTTVGE
jgi:hypothetical protein